MSGAEPRVTVVVAAYHRPVLLRRALETLRAQTVEDWEGLVIGDAVTDDTAGLVASFEDPRLSFHNLPRNVGHQAGPNNEGIRRARAGVVALLNQDDLWFPDHLARGLAELDRTGADLVLACGARPGLDGRVALSGVAPGRRLEPWVVSPASNWILRRAAAERVGPLRGPAECFDDPPHDWLMRAHRAGLDMRLVPYLTVVTYASGMRSGSYLSADDDGHRQRAQAIREDPQGLRVELLTAAAYEATGDLLQPWPLRRMVRRLARDLGWRVARTRTMPLRFALRYRRRGGFIRHLRRVRGLSPGPAAPRE